MTALVRAFWDSAPRRRTSGAMTASVLLHAALVLWLVLRPHAAGEREMLTGIEYFDALPAAAPPAVVAAVETPSPVYGTQAEETRFARRATEAESEPEPQSDYALDDRIAARLDALRESNRVAAIAAGTPAPARLLAAGPGGPPAPRGDGIALSRGHAERGPLALARGAPVARRLDAAVAPTPGPKVASEKPAEAPTATRRLEGASIIGPVADRPIVTHAMPEYPEWAKRDAVEGTVTVRFIVRADGTIKENVFVQKTAGFEDFDLNAMAAIRAWRFAPLTGGRLVEQWGAITFHYRLRDAG